MTKHEIIKQLVEIKRRIPNWGSGDAAWGIASKLVIDLERDIEADIAAESAAPSCYLCGDTQPLGSYCVSCGRGRHLDGTLFVSTAEPEPGFRSIPEGAPVAIQPPSDLERRIREHETLIRDLSEAVVAMRGRLDAVESKTETIFNVGVQTVRVKDLGERVERVEAAQKAMLAGQMPSISPEQLAAYRQTHAFASKPPEPPPTKSYADTWAPKPDAMAADQVELSPHARAWAAPGEIVPAEAVADDDGGPL